MRRTGVALVVLALAACGRGGSGEPAPRRDLVGVWDLVTVNGAALPAPSPEEPNVTLESVVMTLEADGDYTLASSFHLAEESAQSMTIGGTWVGDDDALTFETEHGPAIVMFGYRLDDGVLRMVDENDNEWAMRRR